MLHPPSETQSLPVGERGSIIIPPGYYSFDWFDFLLNSIPGVSFKVHRYSKKVTLMVRDRNLKLRLNKEVAKLLNLPKQKLEPNVIYEGKYNMNPLSLIFLHCQQLNTSKNFYNGQHSNVLNVIPTHPNNHHELQPNESTLVQSNQTKTLKNDVIDQITFSIRDNQGRIINYKGTRVFIEFDIF